MRRFVYVMLTVVLLTAAVSVQSVSAQEQPAQVAAVATVVNANHLNVRNAPTTAGGVIAVLNRGYQFTVLGRTADSSWWQLALVPSGQIGWSSGAYLQIASAHLVPVVASPAPTPASVATATVTAYNLNVRAIPNPYTGQILRTIRQSEVYVIVGRNNVDPRWYELRMPDGSTGWVNGRYVNETNTHLVPITYTGGVDPVPLATGTVTAYFLNVRTSPNPYIPNIMAVISRHQSYPVIGRNYDSSWWQIRLWDGRTGWVNGRYLSITNAHTVPVTG